MRFTADEYAELAEAAARAGPTTTGYVGEAALAAARGVTAEGEPDTARKLAATEYLPPNPVPSDYLDTATSQVPWPDGPHPAPRRDELRTALPRAA